MDGDKRLRKVSQKTGDRRSVHIVATEEQAAYADWINNNLAGDKDVEHEDDGDDLVHCPDTEANQVGELIGPVVLMFPSRDNLNTFCALWFDHEPEHCAPKVFR